MEDTSQFNEDFIKSYNKERDEGYFLEVDVNHDLPYSPERIKIEKVEKLVTNLYEKTEYIFT